MQGEGCAVEQRLAPTRRGAGTGCTCGFYAYDMYEEAAMHADGVWGQGYLPGVARGAVIGWGKAIVASRGWRARYARPVALLRWEDDHRARAYNETILAAAERYHLPLFDTPRELYSAACEYL